MEMIRALTNGQPSSNVHSSGYDPDTKTLAVCFLAADKKSAGAVYHVKAKKPEDDSLARHHAEMIKDDVSTGSYYHLHIKGGDYEIAKQ